MNKNRVNLIVQAYNKLDKNGDGQVTVADLKGVYNVSKHPKFLNGEWSEEQILKKFLDTFDTKGHEDGVVSFSWLDYCITKKIRILKLCFDQITRDEFINYYAGVSGKWWFIFLQKVFKVKFIGFEILKASIDNDAYFDLMMRSNWRLK